MKILILLLCLVFACSEKKHQKQSTYISFFDEKEEEIILGETKSEVEMKLQRSFSDKNDDYDPKGVCEEYISSDDIQIVGVKVNNTTFYYFSKTGLDFVEISLYYSKQDSAIVAQHISSNLPCNNRYYSVKKEKYIEFVNRKNEKISCKVEHPIGDSMKLSIIKVGLEKCF